ncbi:unnamed protein product [Adineta steineri]|uniref:Uncharacterized protein n=1 Tax=Adineta steineri TaxID=433720 RepID=A0A814SZT2_9BILA|nr:unnamed protein product [Adineta steineri]CAF0848897.1 unnamed protein product [Adineta steineri]CAF1154967.1 unnamed protein product [Adineta steineri]
MSATKAVYVTKQPQNKDIYNGFGLMGNENFLQSWIFKEGTCGCTGSYYTTLTDTRLLLRTEDTKCCSCCCEQNYNDASIFLRDIAEMRESTESHDCCSFFCGKCCSGPKYMELRGSFGSEILHISKLDMLNAQMEIPAAIGNCKLVSQY